MRSRLMGVVTVCIGTGPLGQLAAGALSDGLGSRGAVIANCWQPLGLICASRRRCGSVPAQMWSAVGMCIPFVADGPGLGQVCQWLAP